MESGNDSNDLVLDGGGILRESIGFDCSTLSSDVVSDDEDAPDLSRLCGASADDVPSLYSCSDLSQAKGLIIPFNYKVYFADNIGSDNSRGTATGTEIGNSILAVTTPKKAKEKVSPLQLNTVADLEYSILNYVADKMELWGDDCEVGRHQSSLIRRQLDEEGTSLPDNESTAPGGGNRPSPLIGLSSDPADVVIFADSDACPAVFQCVSPTSDFGILSSDESGCPKEYMLIPLICTFVQGKISALFDADTDGPNMDAWANSVVNQIRAGMQSNAIVSEGAKVVNFVFSNELNSIAFGNDSGRFPDESAGGSNSNKTGRLFAGVVGCTLLITTIAFFFSRRQQRVVEEAVTMEPQGNEGICPDDGSMMFRTSVGTRKQSSFIMETSRATFSQSKKRDDRGSKNRTKITVFNNDPVSEEAMSEPQQHRRLSSPLPNLSRPSSPVPSSQDNDENATVATRDSGVSLYLDISRVDSTLSEVTWSGPPQNQHRVTHDESGRIIRAMGSIAEEEGEERSGEDILVQEEEGSI